MAVDLFYADPNGEDIGIMHHYSMDMEISEKADSNTFEIKTHINNDVLGRGYLVYVEGTEIGGVVDYMKVDTQSETLYYGGRTWRGTLASHVMRPNYLPSDYITGDLSEIVQTLISPFFHSMYEFDQTPTGVTATYEIIGNIDFYTTVTEFLRQYNHKLYMRLNPQTGKVIIKVNPIIDISDTQEITSELFDMEVQKNWGTVNYLYCHNGETGSAEIYANLYADANGQISNNYQTYRGFAEIAELYVVSAKSYDELVAKGTEQFRKLIDSDTIKITLNNVEADVGDKFTAYEEHTGVQVTQYISRKIFTITEDEITVQYTARP